MSSNKTQFTGPTTWSAFEKHIIHYKKADQKRISEAFHMAATIHKDQKRHSGDPYITHLTAVAIMLIDLTADPDTIIAALLHDAIEDTELTIELLEKTFGSDIALMVDALTKLEAEDFSESLTLDNKTETIRKLFTLMQEDARIIVIKLFDRLHNMRTVQFLSKDKQKRMAQETLNVYAKIADRLSMLDVRDELENLAYAVLHPSELDELLALQKYNAKKGEEIIKNLQKTLNIEYKKYEDSVHMHFERKHFPDLQLQHKAQGVAASGVTGSTVIFVCDTISICYEVLGILHQKWKREILSFQDYINAPEINGYQGIHTTIILEDGTRVRCKIRTQDMQAYARQGITTLCFDTHAKGLLEYLPWTEQISLLSEDTEEKSEEFWKSLQRDILGEAILIHGPNDEIRSLPQGATALDGAFHLFGAQALKLTSLSINGEKHSLNTPITRGMTISMEMGKSYTVNRQWLDYVDTGYSFATIRKALSKTPIEDKQKIGAQTLQAVFDRYGKGDISHYLQHSKTALQQLGVRSIQDMFTSIADGALQPSEVLSVVTQKKENHEDQSSKITRVRITLRGQKYEYNRIQHLVNDHSKKYGIIQERQSLHELGSGKFKSHLCIRASKKEDIDRFIRDIEEHESIQSVTVLPGRALVTYFIATLAFSIGTWAVFIHFLPQILRQHTPAWIVYSSVLPVLGSTILLYRFCSNYFPRVRNSRWFVIGMLAINTFVISMYAAMILVRELDVLQLSLFFPLTILVVSTMMLAFVFAQRDFLLETKQTTALTEEEWKALRKRKVIGYLIRFGAVTIWGIQPLYIKYTITNSIDPGMRVFLVNVGALIPSAIALGILLLLKKADIRKTRIPYTALFALIVISELVYNYLINASLLHTSSTNVILLNNFAPVVALIVAALFWRTSIPYLKKNQHVLAVFAAFIVGGLGSTILFYNDIKFATATHLFGDFLAVLLMLTDVVVVVSIIRYIKNLQGNQSVLLHGNIFLISVLVMAPMYLLGQNNVLNLTYQQLLFGLGSGVITGLGLLLSLEAYRRIDGFLAFLMFNIAIFITFVVEAFILKAIPSTWLLVVGGIMIISASTIAEWINSHCEKQGL